VAPVALAMSSSKSGDALQYWQLSRFVEEIMVIFGTTHVISCHRVPVVMFRNAASCSERVLQTVLPLNSLVVKHLGTAWILQSLEQMTDFNPTWRYKYEPSAG
jgi:hypothetical protein